MMQLLNKLSHQNGEGVVAQKSMMLRAWHRVKLFLIKTNLGGL